MNLKTGATFVVMGIVTVLIVQHLLHQHYLLVRAQGHQQVQMRVELAAIKQAIQMAAIGNRTLFSPASLRHLDDKSLYALLSNTNSGTRFLPFQPNWDAKKEILDPWGMPIRINVEFVTNENKSLTAVLGLWSVGLNRKDENGHGDDIFDATDILVDDLNQPI